MSAKWHRSRQWDDEHIPRWAWPARVLLRAFSSIPLAVVLLSLVVVYAVLASVPIGLLALIPTWALYALTLVLAVGAAGVGTGFLAGRLAGRSRPAGRFAAYVIAGLTGGAGGAWAWGAFAWPVLHFDPVTGEGVRFFVSFAHDHASTTLRRLPALEMSELEFYSWWPLRVILLLFVLNMFVATVRRIEFAFVNIGVLTVHTGIITMALGSVYYSNLKLEGDTLLRAGIADARGSPAPGPPQEWFYDNTRVALWLSRDGLAWEQRPLSGVPRYNDYNLGAVSGQTASGLLGEETDAGASARRALDVPVPHVPEGMGLVDPLLALRIVGYASYAEPFQDAIRVDLSSRTGVRPGTRLNPLRLVRLVHATQAEREAARDNPSIPFVFLPGHPAGRVLGSDDVGMEYTIRMSEQRWSDLAADVPPGTAHALVVEVAQGEGPAAPLIIPVRPGSDVEVGSSGWRVMVDELAPHPPMPIITPGFEGADSSVAIVRVASPAGEVFRRWVYHRFPEIGQDILDDPAGGRPIRRDPDPRIRIAYIDASKPQFYIDERPDGSVRMLLRDRAGANVLDGLEPGGFALIAPGLAIELAQRWDHVERISRPRPVPPAQRKADRVGTHDHAMLGVEVSLPAEAAGTPWSQIVWVPFSRYVEEGLADDTRITLPDGSTLRLAFGRVRHRLPGFGVSLVDFRMLSYDHRGSPRDYRSTLRVVPTTGRVEEFTHEASLNAPLTAPYMWSDARPWIENAGLRLASGLNPFQFKFSQAGWDAEGWRQAQAMVDAGQLERPFARFTILQVGNNPGIHIVALGGMMVALGTPWAFYVKPWIMRRRRDALRARAAEKKGAGVQP